MAEFARRGFVLHYVIDATEGDANVATMLEYLPGVFRAAGLAVVGPQLVALRFFTENEDGSRVFGCRPACRSARRCEVDTAGRRCRATIVARL